MTFEEILDQAVTLLQRRGRVTYGTLKAQFQLDDGLLEILKDELLFSHPVVDKDGRGLEWMGEKTEGSDSTSPLDQKPPLDRPETHSTSVELPPVEPHTPDAERRQLTVMFCDLVGSTSCLAYWTRKTYET